MSLGAAIGLALVVGLLDPAGDAGGPFEYFVASTTRLPVYRDTVSATTDLDAGFRITPEGHLACRRGRLVVYVGRELRPLAGRARRWLDGHTPIADFDDAVDGAQLRCQMMAARVEGLPGDAALLRLIVIGGTRDCRTRVAVGYVADAGLGPAWPPLAPRTEYALGDDHATADDRLLFTFPVASGLLRLATVDIPYDAPFRPLEVAALTTTPVCLASYDLVVGARQRRSLVFRFSSRPVAAALALPALRRADLDELAVRTTREWGAWLDRQPLVLPPSEKARETYLAALMRLQGRPAAVPELPEEAWTALRRAALQRGLVRFRAGPETELLSPWGTALRAWDVVRRGELTEVPMLLAGLLLQTTATHQFPDAVAAPAASRQRYDTWGLPLSLATDAAYVALLRAMVLQETAAGLRLFPAAPSTWLVPGSTLEFQRLETRYGRLSAKLSSGENELVAELVADELTSRPSFELVLPAGFQSDANASAGVVPWPAGASTLRVAGRWVRPAGATYAAAVEAYRQDYAEVASSYLAAGGAFTPPPQLRLQPLSERQAEWKRRYGPRD